jgi:hypothetical protein
MRTVCHRLRLLGTWGLLCVALGTAAQSNPDAVVTGSARETGTLGYEFTMSFSCRGLPNCVGTYTSTERFENCSNVNTASDRMSLSGLNLAASGAIQGSLVLENVPEEAGCFYKASSTPVTLTYTATWNATTGTATGTLTGIDHDDNTTFSFPFSLTANVDAPAPVFPMTVTSNITPATASASAQIQFRPQDVGKPGSVFVFAYVARSKVPGGSAKPADGPMADSDCVIAQVSPSGQLTPIGSSQLQAFFSGTLSSAGAAVRILDNASTPALTGATFYVGYGPSAGTMFDEGVFRDAVLIPGTGTCPLLPFQTALWWNPRESGWGLNLNQQGGKLFGTLFTYDAARAPRWLVMSGGELQADGRSFMGDLYRTDGPAFNAVPFTPIGPGNLVNVGRMSLSFLDANAASLTYTVDGVQVTKQIQRQVYGTRASNCMPAAGARTSSVNYQDLWWNAAESGWGLNITHQDNTLFATLFNYDAAGRDLWLVMSAGQWQPDGSYLGDLYRTKGSAFNAVPIVPTGPGDVEAVGTMRLRFTNGETGQVTYTYNGTTVTKEISRQVFSGPVSSCN